MVELARRVQQRLHDLLGARRARGFRDGNPVARHREGRWENKGAVMRYNVFAWARGGTSTGNANAAHVIQRNDRNGSPKFYF